MHIQPLSKDHHFSLLFCWKIRQGLKNEIEPERIRKYVKQFWETNMMAHFREEEEILFCPLKDELVIKAIDEHRQIIEMIDKIMRAEVSILPLILASLADMIESHVRFEERELFPHLEYALTNEELQEVGRKLNRPETVTMKDDHDDEFWLRKKHQS